MSSSLYKTFIMRYLQEQGIDTSSWKSYQPYYNRYRARCMKYMPQNYEQFANLCCFRLQKRKRNYLEDLGSFDLKSGGWHKKNKPKEPKEPKPPRVLTFHPSFNEERFWRDQKKEWSDYKIRMQRYREGKIRNQEQQGTTGKEKDMIPYMFKYAIRCLAGVYPIECYPEDLEEYKEELLTFLNSTNCIEGEKHEE